jgi:hypothetical protein
VRYRTAGEKLLHEHWSDNESRKERPIRQPPSGAAERSFLLALVMQSRCAEGFDDFVTSIVAPTATGWNGRCRAGFAPAEDACPCTSQIYLTTRSSGNHRRCVKITFSRVRELMVDRE